MDWDITDKKEWYRYINQGRIQTVLDNDYYLPLNLKN